MILNTAPHVPKRQWRLLTLLFTIVGCLGCVGSAPALAQVEQSGTQASGTSATVEECLTAVDASGRSATFAGQMVAVSGTARMTMRIDVQERAPGDSLFHTLNAPGLGVWRRSATGVKIYKYLKQVTNLPAPGVFRAIVRFRWLNDQGHLIKRSERRTPTCEQPDTRPKLLVTFLRAIPLRGSPEAEYQIVLRNEGRGAAGAFGVSLSVNGITQQLPQVPSLAAGARTVLEAEGPRCTPGSTLEVQLDSAHQLAEAISGGLTYSTPCPLGETGSGTVGDTSTGALSPAS